MHPTISLPCAGSTGWTRPLSLVLCAVLLSACASKPASYPIRAAADPVINRDETGNPLSVVVRIYQLRDRKAFSALNFDGLTSGRSDTELFGNELIERSEVIVVPGQQVLAATNLTPETRYIGLVGMFRQPDIDSWRYLIAAEAVRSNGAGLAATLGGLLTADARRHAGLSFAVRDCSLEIVSPTPELLPGQSRQGKTVCPAPAELSGASAAPPALATSGSARAKPAGKTTRKTKAGTAGGRESER